MQIKYIHLTLFCFAESFRFLREGSNNQLLNYQRTEENRIQKIKRLNHKEKHISS